MLITIAFFFSLNCIEGNKSLSCEDRGNKFIRVRSIMTMLVKVQMLSLMNTMSTHRLKELNMIEGSACSCFHLTWKPTSRTMVAKVSRKLHHGFMCIHYHERNIKGGYP